MATMNISLPDEMRDWVNGQIATGRYAGASDYLRDLIRRDQADVAELPALVDEGATVALRVLDTEAEQAAAMLRGQARLLSFGLAAPVPQIGRSLDLHAKLLLSTGPYADAATVIEDCWLAALESLIPRHGGPVWDE